MTCMKQEFCIHEKYCQRHIGQNFDSCILFSRNSKPMTNEEWFCGLSTEEKAKVLFRFFGDGVTFCERNYSNTHLFFTDDDYISDDSVYKWLKEVHKE